MLKQFILWLEERDTRTRKVVVLVLLAVWSLATISLFTAIYFKVEIEQATSIYGLVCAALAAGYGFYTATNAQSDADAPIKGADIERVVREQIDKIKSGEN